MTQLQTVAYFGVFGLGKLRWEGMLRLRGESNNNNPE